MITNDTAATYRRRAIDARALALHVASQTDKEGLLTAADGYDNQAILSELRDRDPVNQIKLRHYPALPTL